MIDDTNRCTFAFADGRQCKLPQSEDDMGLCYFHARKYLDRMKAREAGLRISKFLNNRVLTASDFNSALAALFSATALGYMKPKAAATLAYLAQIMLQTQRLAKEEYLHAYQAPWQEAVQRSATFNPSAAPSPEPALDPNAPYTPAPLPPISAELPSSTPQPETSPPDEPLTTNVM
jgi:hypothetical protein